MMLQKYVKTMNIIVILTIEVFTVWTMFQE